MLELLTVFDWVSPLLQVAYGATGQVSIEASAGALDALEKAGVRCGAPMLIHETGGYLFAVRRSDLPKARRVLARMGVHL